MSAFDKHSDRIQSHQLRRHRAWCVRGPADADIERATSQQPILLGHAGLNLMNLELRMVVPHSTQHLRHRIKARISDSNANHRVRRSCRARGGRSPLDVAEDLPRLGHIALSDRGQADVVRAALKKSDT